MPKASTYRKDGQLAQSTRTRNKQLASTLPNSNSPLCQALNDFIRLLLGIQKPSDLGPSSPSTEQLGQFHRDWRADLLESQDFLSVLYTNAQVSANDDLRFYGKKKVLKESHRGPFLQHLVKTNFPRPCFNWNEGSSSAWNEAFSNLILQHWNCARSTGLFLAYPMDPDAAGNSSTILALITRWFNGRRDKIRREERMPGSAERQKQLIQKAHWRQRLAVHRTETLQGLKVPEKFQKIFEDPLCNSDTEEQQDGSLVKVKLQWRSKTASLLAASVDRLTARRKQEGNGKAFGPGQLLELSRINSTGNHQAVRSERVPRCLAVDFYDQTFLEGLGKQARDEMRVEARLGLPDLWIELETSGYSPQ
ncbi:hypothetical protein PTTG_09821 [Puccinia triticina 1-1 BBBD Race 1]|uniref:Uncharacterized protein n=1 Tax=Puccinia triticina (isolate 1-1 / race 1 (BBBD)) TaxID=630390 RepID=A0A0C4F9E5_PUCT1|nr:hypothetical protein PTTG_09821 [Puccinia triticina 1-1 BBBD Race 1]